MTLATTCTPRTVPSRSTGSIRMAAILYSLAFAFAACTDATGPLPQEGVPDELEFYIGEFGIGT